jgi:hypothetical protein
MSFSAGLAARQKPADEGAVSRCAGRLTRFGTRVNSVKNDDAGLIEPMTAAGGATA